MSLNENLHTCRSPFIAWILVHIWIPENPISKSVNVAEWVWAMLIYASTWIWDDSIAQKLLLLGMNHHSTVL